MGSNLSSKLKKSGKSDAPASLDFIMYNAQLGHGIQDANTTATEVPVVHQHSVTMDVDPRRIIRTVSSTSQIRLRIEDVKKRNTANCPASFAGLKIIAVANYDYRSTESSDISFLKGDRFLVLDDSKGDWWKVQHLGNGHEGYIPTNFIAEDMSIESEDWFFGNIGRKEAERLLMADVNKVGTFLLRNSDQDGGKNLSLSVKRWEENKQFHIKHYKIKQTNSGKYYLADNQLFLNLQQLVNFYKMLNMDNKGPGIQIPCPKPQPQIWDLSPQFRDQWEIERSEIKLRCKIGQGNFAEVWLGTFKEDKEVAVKTFHAGTKKALDFLQEAAIMKKFHHERLVQLYAVCSREEPIWIVLEFMKKGSLLKYLQSKIGFLNFTDQVYIAEQIASGMKYLEEQQYIHRDLAARNILVGENNLVKICDFGLAKLINEEEYSIGHAIRLPIRWTAPECMDGKFTLKSDVWSFGILVMEIFTFGEMPYRNFDSTEVIRRVLLGYRLPRTKDMPNHVYQVLLQCWDVLPEKRPSFRYLKQYFEDCEFASENLCAIATNTSDYDDYSDSFLQF